MLVSVASIDRSGTTLFWWQRWDLLRSKGSSDTSQASGEIEELRRVKEKREDKGKGFDLEEVPHPHSIHHHCPCSVERVKRSLVLLGPGNLDDMIKKGNDVEVKCEFCCKVHTVKQEELLLVRKEVQGVTQH